MSFITWRERRSYVQGKCNTIENHGVVVHSRLQVKGSNNYILLEKGVRLVNARIYLEGNNISVIIKNNSYLRGSTVYCQDNDLKVEIGSYTYVSSANMAVTEGCSLVIGDECMLGGGIKIKTGDSHSVLNSEGRRINCGKNVKIGNRVWIGEDAKILKGVTIENDSVVATGAIVTKDIKSNQLWGGNPAKLLKENISWNRSRKI